MTGSEPTTPKLSEWAFPPPSELRPKQDFVSAGADLEPGTILAGYRASCFPMPVDQGQIGWFSPDPRGVIFPPDFHISRSLRKSIKRYNTTVNRDFSQVLDGCAEPSRPNGWIDANIKSAYLRLHDMGWAHSIEVWDNLELVGGVYGLSFGSFFAGESMFHRKTDASKVALAQLVDFLMSGTGGLLDVQWLTPHLKTLGAVAIPRTKYVNRLETAATQPHIFASI